MRKRLFTERVVKVGNTLLERWPMPPACQCSRGLCLGNVLHNMLEPSVSPEAVRQLEMVAVGPLRPNCASPLPALTLSRITETGICPKYQLQKHFQGHITQRIQAETGFYLISLFQSRCSQALAQRASVARSGLTKPSG